MVGSTVNGLRYVSPFQYVSCSFPAIVHEFSSLIFVSEVPIDASLSIYQDQSQHTTHFVDEPTDDELENVLEAYVNDSDEDLGDDSDDNNEHMAESISLISSSPIIPTGPKLCMICHQP